VIPRRGKRPRRRPWQELHDRRRQGIFLFPSLLTTGNLFCGFFSLLLAAQHRFTEAALVILVAMVMDLLDGRVARLMKATSQFGVEYDSLADVVSFCVAPAFLLYAFALQPLGRAAWFGAFLFLVCGALRLARFNVQTGSADRRFFVGLSTPAAAGVVASVVIMLGGDEPSRTVRVSWRRRPTCWPCSWSRPSGTGRSRRSTSLAGARSRRCWSWCWRR
jgi:CDP-diacylglycerol--serine O-phosphatidyltransferase